MKSIGIRGMESGETEKENTEKHANTEMNDHPADLHTPTTKPDNFERDCCMGKPGDQPKEDAAKHLPATKAKRGRWRKCSVPKQLPQADRKYSFLSKYRDQSYPSLGRTVRKRRAAIPASAEPAHLTVKQKSVHCQKYSSDKNVTTLSCPDCPFVTARRGKLTEHINRHHKGSPTSCDLCGKIFHNQNNMLRHRSSHTGPQHCCDVCGKMFKIQKALARHRKTHEEGYTKPVFPCKLCSKTFCSQYIVDSHVRSFHLGQRKSYLCSYCGKKFTTKHSLQEHVNAHSGIKPHICEICGKGFSYDSALRDHKFTHGDEKQFKCDLCDKTFCQRSGLKMHMRIHKDVKQFQCQECGREFTQKQALQRHERVHKGVKPYLCKLCSRSFSDASIIRRHLTLVHKIHKDAKKWREDIVCTVEPDLEYHVGYIGKAETDQQPDETEEDNTDTKASTLVSSKTGSERNSKKSKSPLKNNRGDENIPLPLHLATVTAVSESEQTLCEGGQLTSSATSKPNNPHPVTACTRPQEASCSQQNLFLSAEYLPQTHDPSCLQTPSQDALYALAAGSAMQDGAGRQGFVGAGVLSSMDEVHHSTCLCTSISHSADTAAPTACAPGGFMQSKTIGERQHKPPFTPGPLTQALVKDSTPVSSSTTIATPQPLPSLYYYSQLASQFGMSLPDYPHIANTIFSSLGLSPSSPSLDHPSPSFSRPHSLGHQCAGVDPSSSILLRLQGPGLSTSDLSQGHGGVGRDPQEACGGGHGVMLSSSVAESVRSGLLFESSGEGLNMSAVLPAGSGSHKCGDSCSGGGLSAD